MFSQFPKKLILSLPLILIALACDNKSESTPVDPITKAVQQGSLNVSLNEISSEECLNLGKYFERIRTFPGETKTRKVSTDFRIISDGGLPRNFYQRLVAGNFQLIDSELKETPDFPMMEQSDCQNVTLVEGETKVTYKIVSAKKDSLKYENAWGGLTAVTWKSPTWIEFEMISPVSDNLCQSGSKGRSSLTYEITWGDSSIYTDQLPEKMISQKFLQSVATAKGVPLSSLYTSPAFRDVESGAEDESSDIDRQLVDSDSSLLVSRLKVLQDLPVKPELLLCY